VRFTRGVLTQVNLTDAKLNRARLDGADLGNAVLNGLDFANATLTNAAWVSPSWNERVRERQHGGARLDRAC